MRGHPTWPAPLPINLRRASTTAGMCAKAKCRSGYHSSAPDAERRGFARVRRTGGNYGFRGEGPPSPLEPSSRSESAAEAAQRTCLPVPSEETGSSNSRVKMVLLVFQKARSWSAGLVAGVGSGWLGRRRSRFGRAVGYLPGVVARAVLVDAADAGDEGVVGAVGEQPAGEDQWFGAEADGVAGPGAARGRGFEHGPGDDLGW